MNISREKIELTVEKLAAHGSGLCRLNGEVIFTPNVLPGEKISVSLQNEHKGVRWGQLEKVIQASPHRITPPCPLAANGSCQACDFSFVEPAAALELKAQAALGSIAEAYGKTIKLIQSPQKQRYRRRVTLHLGSSSTGKGLAVGYHNQHRRVVKFTDCLVAAKEINFAAAILNNWAEDLTLTSVEAEIHIFAGMEESEGLLISFTPAPPRKSGSNKKSAKCTALPDELIKLIGNLPKLLNELPMNYALFVQKQPGIPVLAIGSKGGLKVLSAVSLPGMDLKIMAGPLVFTQINPYVNSLMLDLIVSKTSAMVPARALDLYCGIGNISFPLLKGGFSICGVESSSISLSAAKANAKGLKGINFITGESAVVCRDLAKKGEKFDLVVMDPPRAGARDMAPVVSALSPKQIIYVSCHPATLARDLPSFISLGYDLESLYALDMFPGTSHMETVAFLAL